MPQLQIILSIWTHEPPNVTCVAAQGSWSGIPPSHTFRPAFFPEETPIYPKTAVDNKRHVHSWRCAAFVGANSFAHNLLFVRMNSHPHTTHLRFLVTYRPTHRNS